MSYTYIGGEHMLLEEWNKLQQELAQLRSDNLRLQKQVDEARTLFKLARISCLPYQSVLDWLAANPKESECDFYLIFHTGKYTI